MTTYSTSYADGPIASDLLEIEVVYSLNANANAHDVLTFAYFPDGSPSETATASAVFGIQMTYHEAMIESVVASAVLQNQGLSANSFSATASGTFAATLGHTLSFNASASDVLASQTTYRPNLLGSTQATDAVSLVRGISVSDNAIAHDVLTYQYIAGAVISENANAASLLQDQYIVNPAIVDCASVQDYPIPNFVYNTSVIECAWAGIVDQEPGNGVTTWAINTRTNAVTQYSNWGSFNSFASVGRKYLAADQDGLYELNGAQDITSPVIGDIQGGFFEPAGGRLAGFKGVYLSAKGQGLWQLTLTAGDGRKYAYQRTSNPNLMTTKIEVGKGLRSRYFGWELIAIDGQDFDLDRVEFVPMQSGRRI